MLNLPERILSFQSPLLVSSKYTSASLSPVFFFEAFAVFLPQLECEFWVGFFFKFEWILSLYYMMSYSCIMVCCMFLCLKFGAISCFYFFKNAFE